MSFVSETVLYAYLYSRRAEKSADRVIHDFAKRMFHEMGTRVYVLSASEDLDGSIFAAGYITS